MIDILNSYLVQHKSINIPGIGTIFLERVPARADFVNKQIFPPNYVFRFNKYLDAPNKDFFSYLASKKQIPDYEAIRLYNEFANDLRTKIRLAEKVEWDEMGVFTLDATGEILFQPTELPWQVADPITAERVIRSNSAHSILVGDKEKTNIEMTELLKDEEETVVVKKRPAWHLYALILFAIALILLLVHFYRKGFRWQSIANQQPIELKVPS